MVALFRQLVFLSINEILDLYFVLVLIVKLQSLRRHHSMIKYDTQYILVGVYFDTHCCFVAELV